jgi:hypothetical protein
MREKSFGYIHRDLDGHTFCLDKPIQLYIKPLSRLSLILIFNYSSAILHSSNNYEYEATPHWKKRKKKKREI